MQLQNKSPNWDLETKLRENQADAVCVNDVWAMYLAYDQLAIGRKLSILMVVDTLSRYCPVTDHTSAIEVRISSLQWIAFAAASDIQKIKRVDNGSELISRNIEPRACQRDVKLDLSRPGKPTENAFMFRRETIHRFIF